MKPGVKSRHSVLVVDDHPIVRSGLEKLIDKEPDLAVLGGASDAAEALEILSRSPFDLVIVDIVLGADDGLELIRSIKADAPDLPVLALSMHSETLFAERALRAGAQGYVMKEAATEDLVEAIRHVLGGGVYISPKMKSRLVQRVGGTEVVSAMDALSDRELQVFRLIGQSIGPGEIATRLGLSVKTVESYREQLKQKLSVESGPALNRHAILWMQGDREG